MNLNFSGFDEHFSWRNEPGPRKSKKDELDKNVGWFFDGSTLSIAAPVGRDFWQHTYYTPLLVKDDGPLCLVDVPLTLITDREITMETRMRINPKSQFDQGGLFIRYNSQCWMKAGIEYCDRTVRLSAVVTNAGFSDWSTQILFRAPAPRSDNSNSSASSADSATSSSGSSVSHSLSSSASGCAVGDGSGAIDLGLRLTLCKDYAVVFEFTLDGAKEASSNWNFVRICRLGSANEVLEDANSVQLGPFACCPIAQKGCVAEFSDFHITPGRKVRHKLSEDEH
jgi:regulation of enolase protein 1 (concanavalin A-like superfamily)